MLFSSACPSLDVLYVHFEHFSWSVLISRSSHFLFHLEILLKKTKCTRIVTLHHAHKALINGILRFHEGGHLIVTESPTLQYTFPQLGAESADDSFVHYPSAERRPDLDSPGLYLHSSGSTGFPKPIAHSYRIQIQWMALRTIEPRLGHPIDVKDEKAVAEFRNQVRAFTHN